MRCARASSWPALSWAIQYSGVPFLQGFGGEGHGSGSLEGEAGLADPGKRLVDLLAGELQRRPMRRRSWRISGAWAPRHRLDRRGGRHEPLDPGRRLLDRFLRAAQGQFETVEPALAGGARRHAPGQELRHPGAGCGPDPPGAAGRRPLPGGARAQEPLERGGAVDPFQGREDGRSVRQPA